jgi:hypothetical protein
MWRFNWLRQVALVVGVVLSGCNGDGGADMPGGEEVTPMQACTEFSQSFCGKLFSCLALVVNLAYGDPATCVERQRLTCTPAFGLNGNSTTPQRLRECAQAVAGITCADLANSNVPAACRPVPGQLADGAACGSNAQCRSTYCRAEPGGGGCGRCTARAKAGESCAATSCEQDLACGRDQRCAPTMLVGEGATCGGGALCQYPLTCLQGRCVRLLGAGAECGGPAMPVCDVYSGLACNLVSRRCEMVHLATPGEPCGLVGNAITLCRGGGSCKVPMGMNMGTCVAPVMDGGMCDPRNNLVCLSPASCTAGTCTVFNPTMCR